MKFGNSNDTFEIRNYKQVAEGLKEISLYL